MAKIMNYSEKNVVPNINTKTPFFIVESYKNIRTNIISLLNKNGGNVLAIASPNAGEGKSTTAINVAITLSQLNKKVVLLDADLRRPSMNKRLKIDAEIGCVDYLCGNCGIDDITVHYNNYLDVIISGTKAKNPTELFSSENFESLIDELKERYDYVVIDTPPINPVSDSLIISQKCDALIMVVKAGSTTYYSFNKAYDALKVLDIDISGVILNGSVSNPSYSYKYKNKNSQYYKY